MSTPNRERAEAVAPPPLRPSRSPRPTPPDRERAEVVVVQPLRPSRVTAGHEPPQPGPPRVPAAEAWKRLGRLASRQGGWTSRTQLQQSGLQRAGVREAVRAGRLHPRGGLFLVGHTAPAVDAELHRTLLLGGTGGVLSHRTAAWVWGVGPRPHRLEVTVPSNRRARRNVALHRSRLDPREEVVYKRGLAVTSLLRTIFDCAAVCTDAELEHIVNETAIKGWLHRKNVAVLLELARGRRGARRLRRVLDGRDKSKGWTKSTLEAAFAELARAAGLPPYERGQLVDIGGGDLRECDVLWRELRVMVELDFLPIHETGRVPYRDRRRDRRLGAAGWTVIRVTGDDLANHRDEVIEDLRRTLGMPA